MSTLSYPDYFLGGLRRECRAIWCPPEEPRTTRFARLRGGSNYYYEIRPAPVVHHFLRFGLVPPRGIEPLSRDPESRVLSVERGRR